ncbi:hypothetical protein [Streptomyces sp900116325]|uniref:hypothetical protein n=1 Tax=Streptomyces sp. 900116325 TaxID=3154295 RepID=UPI0033201BBC
MPTGSQGSTSRWIHVRRPSSNPSTTVAYSGGADSALVLAAAVRALGPECVLAVTPVSESLADGELSRARRLADALGVTHLIPRNDELTRPGYRARPLLLL